MKRFVAVVMSLALSLSVVGCSSGSDTSTETSSAEIESTETESAETESTDTTETETAEASEESTPSAETESEDAEATESEFSTGISVDEGLLTVDITLPASWFEDSDDFDTDAYASENGYQKVVQNEDGSVTITMTKAEHRTMLEALTAEYDVDFDEMIESEDTPYIKSIVHSDDFSSFTVTVDREGYESATYEMTPLMLGITGALYQTVAGDDIGVTISIVDADTGEVILESTYPE